VVSAHRTPDLLFEYASTAEARGLEVIIAGRGGAAHLPGMTAAKTVLPCSGVPVQSAALSGTDSLLSIVQMPAGIPVGTLAIGRAGAVNAALLAAAMLGPSTRDPRSASRLSRQADGDGAREPRSEEERVKIGVLGGGQLGRMLALAGFPTVTSSSSSSPAARPCTGSASSSLPRPTTTRRSSG
jgi:5-(carboxyamino)imidazole ribonucleotide mutase